MYTEMYFESYKWGNTHFKSSKLKNITKNWQYEYTEMYFEVNYEIYKKPPKNLNIKIIKT